MVACSICLFSVVHSLIMTRYMFLRIRYSQSVGVCLTSLILHRCSWFGQVLHERTSGITRLGFYLCSTLLAWRVQCPRLFVRHRPVFCRNSCMDRSHFWHRGFPRLIKIWNLGIFVQNGGLGRILPWHDDHLQFVILGDLSCVLLNGCDLARCTGFCARAESCLWARCPFPFSTLKEIFLDFPALVRNWLSNVNGLTNAHFNIVQCISYCRMDWNNRK